MQQLTFTDAEYNLRKKKTRREEFLDTMNQMIPWKDWILMIQPYYPSGKRGRPPKGIETMLRMYLMQSWFNISDAGLEDSLCSSMTTEQERHEAAYMEALRSTVIKITYGGIGGKSLSLNEINNQINELLKAAVQSEGVISLFDSTKSGGENFSLFDPAVLDEISRMKEKNIAVEILKKLMAEQVSLYRRTNVVQSQKFSEKITQLMNSYYNGLITNEEVIKELLKTAQEIAELYKNGKKLGLSQEELAFYDALTKPEHIKDFYQNEDLIALTKELTEMLRKNRTIDWQKKETARAQMRKMVKRLLKKYKYPPENYDYAINTVISQCELWTDNVEPRKEEKLYKFVSERELAMVADEKTPYGSRD